MTFTYDGADYTLPDTLADVSLAQHIGYSDMYGRDIAARAKEIELEPDEDRRNLGQSLLYLEMYCNSFSYYSTIPLDQVKENIDVKQVLSYMGATQLNLALEVREIEVQPAYVWEGTVYYITPPASIESDTYGTFMAVQELAKKMLRFADGDWSVVPSLCAAYLRPEGEDFDPNNFEEGTPGYAHMLELTMDIALAVMVYLDSTLTLFINSLESYIPPEGPVS